MEDTLEPTPAVDREPSGTDVVMEHLLQRAGRRPAVPAEVLAEAREAAREQWKWTLRIERRRRGLQLAGAALATAAALLLVLDAGDVSRFVGKPGRPSALIEHVSGSLVSVPDARPLHPGGALAPGSRIETRSAEGRAGRAALRLSSGVSLRLDVETRLHLISASELSLESGAVYLDTGTASPTAGQQHLVAIRTSYGTVTDLGTRFEVRLEGLDQGLKIRVRDGAVELESAETRHRVDAEVELAMGADGTVVRRKIAVHDEAWAWTREILPAFIIEGASLHDFLVWASHEGGWRLRYADPQTGDKACDLRLHGSIEGLGLSEALELTLLGSGLDLVDHVEGGDLVISSAPAR